MNGKIPVETARRTDMYRTSLLSLLLTCCLAAGAAAAGNDASNFSAAGRKLQPVPTGHVPGKDNGSGRGTHNAGEECGLCHKPGGKAPVVFTISGTLYEDRAARKPLKGGEVILQDIDGNVISMTSNETGNFWSFSPIASNPWTVVSHSGMTHPLYSEDETGFHPADPGDARTWQYKAWVKNGNDVRPMVTIAPVAGATDPNSRMSCSMHHAFLGSRGALWVSADGGHQADPPAQVSFKKHVLPILKNSCVPCHIPGETWTRIVTKTDYEGSPSTKIDYSGLLDLTSYSGSSLTVGGASWTKAGIKDRAVGFQRDPRSSPLLTMTESNRSGSADHPGGSFWSSSDWGYRVIMKWIESGAPDN